MNICAQNALELRKGLGTSDFLRDVRVALVNGLIVPHEHRRLNVVRLRMWCILRGYTYLGA